MLTPIRSENGAFRFAIVGAALIGIAVLIGWLTEAAIGAAVIGAAVIVALVDVLAPVLTSHVHLAVTDTDHERAQARTRLGRSLAWARQIGVAVRREVGDTSPLSGVEDELRDFGADEVIVVTHSGDHACRQERGELERPRRELDVPVTHVAVGDR
jgi:hypothetical protein